MPRYQAGIIANLPALVTLFSSSFTAISTSLSYALATSTSIGVAVDPTFTPASFTKLAISWSITSPMAYEALSIALSTSLTLAWAASISSTLKLKYLALSITSSC